MEISLFIGGRQVLIDKARPCLKRLASDFGPLLLLAFDTVDEIQGVLHGMLSSVLWQSRRDADVALVLVKGQANAVSLTRAAGNFSVAFSYSLYRAMNRTTTYPSTSSYHKQL